MILPILLDYLRVLPQLKVLEEEIKKSTGKSSPHPKTMSNDVKIRNLVNLNNNEDNPKPFRLSSSPKKTHPKHLRLTFLS